MKKDNYCYYVSLLSFLVGIIILLIYLKGDGIGSLADWFGAIGTISAVIVSLWFSSISRRDSLEKLKRERFLMKLQNDSRILKDLSVELLNIDESVISEHFQKSTSNLNFIMRQNDLGDKDSTLDLTNFYFTDIIKDISEISRIWDLASKNMKLRKEDILSLELRNKFESFIYAELEMKQLLIGINTFMLTTNLNNIIKLDILKDININIDKLMTSIWELHKEKLKIVDEIRENV